MKGGIRSRVTIVTKPPAHRHSKRDNDLSSNLFCHCVLQLRRIGVGSFGEQRCESPPPRHPGLQIALPCRKRSPAPPGELKCAKKKFVFPRRVGIFIELAPRPVAAGFGQQQHEHSGRDCGRPPDPRLVSAMPLQAGEHVGRIGEIRPSFEQACRAVASCRVPAREGLAGARVGRAKDQVGCQP